MTTAHEARTVVRIRLEGNAPLDAQGQPVPLRWQNEDGEPLPDDPAPFVYTEVLTGRAALAGFGGGRGNNLYRNPLLVDVYVFVPKGEGLDQAEQIAEQIAVLFRSYRDDVVSLFDATVYPGGDGADLKPPGLTSEVGNYAYCAVEVTGHFDQIG
ncbi:MAG: hypothetical protein GEU95_25330 [Rhizobiales bacterium]|nr:hypothetical protein [Hyphomicrobiales bacterium]